MTHEHREPRAMRAAESPLDPLTLCGSWVIHEGDTIKQYLIVAEPKPGWYLVQEFDIFDDVPIGGQFLIDLEKMAKVDEYTGRPSWTFYDNHSDVRAAFHAVVAK